VQIAKQVSPKHAIAGLSLVDSSGVAKGLAAIEPSYGEACISEDLRR